MMESHWIIYVGSVAHWHDAKWMWMTMVSQWFQHDPHTHTIKKQDSHTITRGNYTSFEVFLKSTNTPYSFKLDTNLA
jgi:hypothetical protein